MLNDFFKLKKGSESYFYKNIISDYNFTNDIPKYKLFIKLDPDITKDRKAEIANGVRSFFKDDVTFLLDLKETVAQVNNILGIF